MGLFDKLLRSMMGGHHGGRYGGGYCDYSEPPPATPRPSGIACPKCGTALAAGAKFCAQCGKPRG